MSQVMKLDSFDPANLPKTVALTLDEMDKAGVSMSIFSVGTAQYFYEPDAAGKARRFNEIFARVVSDHPTRFRFFACLPVPDIDATLEAPGHGISRRPCERSSWIIPGISASAIMTVGRPCSTVGPDAATSRKTIRGAGGRSCHRDSSHSLSLFLSPSPSRR
jgi:hypothetical protein